MSTAEQKVELVKMLLDADDETINQLIAFTRQLSNKIKPCTEDIAIYEKRSDDFIASGEEGFSKAESLDLLRKQIK